MKLIRFFLCLFCVSTFGADRITLTLTFTNNPADGNTFVLNADTRTFKTSVGTPGSQILIGAGFGHTATNTFNQTVNYPFAGGIIPSQTGTNILTYLGAPGQAMVGSMSGTWGTIAYATQAVTTLVAVRVPISGEPTASVRTNNANGLVDGINSFGTTQFSSTAASLAKFVNTDQTQTATGAKTFLSITTSNLVNVGSAVSSRGSATDSEQFGTGSLATNLNSLALGRQAWARATNSIAIGNIAEADTTATYGLALGFDSLASGNSAMAIGNLAITSGDNSLAIGTGSQATGENAITLGNNAISIYTNSIAIGFGVAATAANQIRLGSSSHNVSVPGTLTGTLSGSTASNTTMRGTTTLTSQARFTRATISSLANGNNAAVNPGSETVYMKLTAGPTAAFAINGIANGADGRFLIVENATGQAMTVAYDSGVDPTAANRIYTTTGSDVSSSGNCHALFIYDSTLSRWKLISFTPSAAVSLANPTASVGLTAVNGVAVTAMRSDGAPALDQNIAPDWGGNHRFSAKVSYNASTETLTADNQIITIATRYKQLSSDNGTAGNRTFGLPTSSITSGTVVTIEWIGTNAGELVDDTNVGGSSATVRLSATWTPTQYDSITLHYNGTDWIEDARSTN